MYKIICNNIQHPMPANLQVNRLGKYIYKNLEGAFKFRTLSNTFDVYVTLLYALKEEYGGSPNDVNEMTINISLTTYQNKVRINTIEMDPNERTLGFDLMQPNELVDLRRAMDVVVRKVGNRIRKAYRDYTILF
jgi:hypothetical protein